MAPDCSDLEVIGGDAKSFDRLRTQAVEAEVGVTEQEKAGVPFGGFRKGPWEPHMAHRLLVGPPCASTF